MMNSDLNDKIQLAMNQQAGLKRGMKSRHLFMITLGGVIGTGLFLASGSTISQAGPVGSIVAYMIGGFIMYMVMMCLGELAVQIPVAGAFQTYASMFIAPSIGYLLGWLFWLNGATTIGIDLVAAGMLLNNLTGISEWIWVLLFGGVLFGFNSLRVGVFGESEFWFAGIKVAAIIACVLVGGLSIMGVIGGHEAIGFKNYYIDGVFPNGIGAILMSMLVVAFAFNGTEIIGVAAGESETPERTIPKAVNNTAIRTLLFYVLSMAVVAAIVPWKEAGVKNSIFAEVFQYAGIPGAYTIMTLVVVTSALSCGNSWAYSATRILWAMSKEGMAPRVLGKLNRYQVPMNALILTMVVAGVSLLCSVIAADTLYLWLISICGLAGILGWMGICASQYCFRKQFIANGGNIEKLKYKVPLFPLVPFLGFFLNLIIVIGLWFDESQRIAIYASVPFIIVVMAYYYIVVAPRQKSSLSGTEKTTSN